ncbi:MAG: carbohydrate porin [Thermodesulfovibrionales bacterium]|nr:carbohydrate porin [Thermodesulfovibrionales bacterium]
MKQTKNRPISLLFFFGICLFFILTNRVSAYDVNEKLSVEGMLTGIYQHADVGGEGTDDAGRGAAGMALGMNFHPTDKDEFQATLSFGAGNGLNYLGLFSLSPYAGDLEDDLKDINGRNRDYLLEAWYKHTFFLSENATLGIIGGIIDSTSYIDDNTFANCERSQFMNEAFVNHRNVNLPSYDLGGVIELDVSNFTIRALAMNSKFESGDDEFTNYNYYAVQAGYKLVTVFGEGNYRVYGYTTNDRFQCPDEVEKGSLQGLGISADQKLSEIVGIFLRASWQDDEAVIDHDKVYSGGMNINGKLWGRENDEIGVAYGFLDGACGSDIDRTVAAEAYVRVQVSQFSDLTLDLQYIDDDLKMDADRDGFIYGVRANAYF